MRNWFQTIFDRRPFAASAREQDSLFDEVDFALEAEAVPEVEPPRWGRAMVLPIVVLFCVLLLVYLQQKAESQRREGIMVQKHFASIRALAERSQGAAQAVLQGVPESVRSLATLSGELENELGQLKAAAAAQGPDAFPVPPLNALEARMRALGDGLAVVQDRGVEVRRVRELAQVLVPKLEAAKSGAGELLGALSSMGAEGTELVTAARLGDRLATMATDASALSLGSDPGSRHSQRLSVELDAYVTELGRLSGMGSRVAGVEGSADQIASLVARLETQAPVLVERANGLVTRAPALNAARQIAATTGTLSDGLLGAIDTLEASYLAAAAERTDYPVMFDALAALTIILVAMFSLQVIGMLRHQAKAAREREDEVRERNRRNQDAILQLLDEISDLADGDLTKHTTVSEEITGAVADAVNYAIDALRELVSRINKTAEAVASSAQTTRVRTSQISRASHTQAAQIVGAANSVQAMADAGRVVSENAATSTEVARQSLDAASRGAQAVRQTISGMEEIREAIQDTAKRLKRLGESSQEIGNIVGLIDDIADQTNVLALNAAIQASMAGEAGRGFGVVADQVQRLAERAQQATKRIEVLVHTIQADTSEAIASMEQSTTGVVGGARLAEDAGGSLREIENVSRNLAEQIQGISGAAADQASRAATLASSMQAVQNFAVQVRSGTNVTAKSADRLAELAQALETSVARFRLPEADAENVVDLMPVSTDQGGADKPNAGEQEQSRERSRA